MQELTFQDSCLDLTDSKQYNISIQASLDGFSLLILHAESNLLHLAYYMPITLSNYSGLIRKTGEIIGKLGLTDNAFHKVTVYLSDRLVKLVPAHLYHEKTIRRTLSPQSPGQKKMAVTGMSLTDDYQMAFSADPALIDFFSEQFRGCIIKHETFPLINYLLKNASHDSCWLNCHFHSGYFFVTGVRENQIQFFNSFEYHSPDDVLFYLASSIQAIGNHVPKILLSGNITEESTLFKRLVQFFPEAGFLEDNCELLEATGWNSDITRFINPLLLDQP